MPPPPLARPFLWGGIAAIVGAAAWAMLVVFAQREFGLLAWGIGGAVGFAMVRAGAHGTLLAAAAGALALLSIVSGKHFAFTTLTREYVAKEIEGVSQSHLDDHRADAAAWIALGDAPTAEQVRTFARDHEFELVDVDTFVREVGPRLRSFATEQPDLATWRAQLVDAAMDRASFVTYLREGFHPADILFAFLGIATAFGMISKATMQLRVLARQEARARSADEPPAS